MVLARMTEISHHVMPNKYLCACKTNIITKAMQIMIPITAGITANTDISIPTADAIEIINAYKFVGSDGAVAAAYIPLTVDEKGDGNTSGAGHIKLQANGKKVRVGDNLDAKNSIILHYCARGECVRP